MHAGGNLRRLVALWHVRTSYMRQTRTRPLYSRNFPPGDAPEALCRRAGKPYRSVRLCPHASSRCPASRPTTGWSTGSCVPARRRTSARLSSSAVRATPKAGRGVQRRMTLSWMLLLEDGSGSFSRRCSLGNSRTAPSRRWNGYVLLIEYFTAPASSVLIVPCRGLTACHNRRASWALPNSGIRLCVPV
jgi:hypothetical protein